MRHVILRIFSVIFLIGLLAGCATDDLHENGVHPDATVLIRGSFDEVWPALSRTLDLHAYPIRTANMDAGILETEEIPAIKAWMPPHLRGKKYPNGQTYSISIQVLKGRTGDNAPSSKIIVRKRLRRKKDFFANDEVLISDGLEEKALAYRIRRELIIDRALKKAHHQGTLNDEAGEE
jgi:hypothetical protein